MARAFASLLFVAEALQEERRTEVRDGGESLDVLLTVVVRQAVELAANEDVIKLLIQLGPFERVLLPEGCFDAAFGGLFVLPSRLDLTAGRFARRCSGVWQRTERSHRCHNRRQV